MLSLLHIENIAVIESADISFDQGFNVLTGETGAGKSIVIDAISAILGERAYRDMIRTGTNKASVRAVFTDVPELSWFLDNGVEYDSETIIQREVHLDGKNVCRVNGTLVSVSILRKLGIQLINIHGQHDSASISIWPSVTRKIPIISCRNTIPVIICTPAPPATVAWPMRSLWKF